MAANPKPIPPPKPASVTLARLSQNQEDRYKKDTLATQKPALLPKPKKPLEPLKFRAPVAQLDEFDLEDLACPLRPPRSPKILLPDERPELPAKQHRDKKIGPKPPARRRKKSEEVNVPIYAQVDYEKKRSQRRILSKTAEVTDTNLPSKLDLDSNPVDSSIDCDAINPPIVAVVDSHSIEEEEEECLCNETKKQIDISNKTERDTNRADESLALSNQAEIYQSSVKELGGYNDIDSSDIVQENKDLAADSNEEKELVSPMEHDNKLSSCYNQEKKFNEINISDTELNVCNSEKDGVTLYTEELGSAGCAPFCNNEKESNTAIKDEQSRVMSTEFKDSESEGSDNDHRLSQISQLSVEQQRDKKVFYIAQELATSERQFVDVLKLLNVNFFETVNIPSVIPQLELARIINSLPQLQQLNEEILRDLELRIEHWAEHPKIADVIVKKGPFLKLYSSYIQNFEIQCNYLDECIQKYPRFAKVVREFELSEICKKLEVKHFMLKPIQRIPQYRLLLEDYQRHLDVNSIDYDDTKLALKIVRDVADHANRSIKLGDHLSKLIHLQSQLDNYEIIKPGRMFLKDGELFKLSRKVRHPRYFILLNDCLLYTSKSPASVVRVQKELQFNGMKVFIPPVEDNENEFNIISTTRSFTLLASSLEDRRQWIEALNNAIQDHNSRKLTFQASLGTHPSIEASVETLQLGHQAPVWIQDVRVTMCQSCTTPFTVMNRRHHCRGCGKVVCGVCSEFRAPLEYLNFAQARVCQQCFDTLWQESSLNEHRNLFKTLGSGNKKKALQLKKEIPLRLKEVAANDAGSLISGWLQRRGRRSWKKLWFVLKEQVLYVYKACEDIVALESIPILGYQVEPLSQYNVYEGINAKLVFQLAHSGQLPLVFYADTEQLASRWVTTMQEASVLH